MATIIKKNLRAKKGTQRWRKNIVVTLPPQDEIDFTPRHAGLLDYNVDNQPINIYQNKDRFKKKTPIDETKLSKNEQKKIKQLASVKRQQQIQKSNEVVDPWSTEETTPKQVMPNIKSILAPHPGQSYNPSIQEYQKLTDQIVQQELNSQKKNIEQRNLEDRVRRLEEKKIKEKEKDKIQRILEEKGYHGVSEYMEKKLAHDLTLIKKIQKEIKTDVVKHNQLRIQKKIKKHLVDATLRKTGRRLKLCKVGKKFIKPTEDEFLPEDDLKTLKNISHGELIVRSQFDNYTRRGLIEPKGKSNKLTKAKVPLYKQSNRSIQESLKK